MFRHPREQRNYTHNCGLGSTLLYRLPKRMAVPRGVAMDWHQIKQCISDYSGLHMDALHVHGSILGLLAAALLLRKPLSSPWPWLVVLVAALANEWFDLTYEIWPTRAGQYQESIKDIWNTMLAPTVLLLAVRYLPCLFVFPAPADAEPAEL